VPSAKSVIARNIWAKSEGKNSLVLKKRGRALRRAAFCANMYEMHQKIIADLNRLADKNKAKILAGFFKTGKGEYGEGDRFIGVNVPNQRKIAKQYCKQIKYSDLIKLLSSPVHEHRLTGVLILIEKYQKAESQEKDIVYKLYLDQAKKKKINNWDLIDLSAPKLVGNYLFDKDRQILYNMAKSENVWERRIAILSTFYFIGQGQFRDTIKISKILLHDTHDLIHKAVGWMLREAGKRNISELVRFLDRYSDQMPRTMLRYALEKFDKEYRDKYLFVKFK